MCLRACVISCSSVNLIFISLKLDIINSDLKFTLYMYITRAQLSSAISDNTCVSIQPEHFFLFRKLECVDLR